MFNILAFTDHTQQAEDESVFGFQTTTKTLHVQKSPCVHEDCTERKLLFFFCFLNERKSCKNVHLRFTI